MLKTTIKRFPNVDAIHTIMVQLMVSVRPIMLSHYNHIMQQAECAAQIIKCNDTGFAQFVFYWHELI